MTMVSYRNTRSLHLDVVHYAMYLIVQNSHLRHHFTPECQSGVYHGVLIITSLLNRIDIDFDTGIAHVGAGVLWQTIYDKLNDAELSGENAMRWGATGAQCGLVSVSGFTLGGGMCWHNSPLHGIGADNAIGIKAITASGEIVDATINDPETSDLRYGMAGTVSQLVFCIGILR